MTWKCWRKVGWSWSANSRIIGTLARCWTRRFNISKTHNNKYIWNHCYGDFTSLHCMIIQRRLKFSFRFGQLSWIAIFTCAFHLLLRLQWHVPLKVDIHILMLAIRFCDSFETLDHLTRTCVEEKKSPQILQISSTRSPEIMRFFQIA